MVKDPIFLNNIDNRDLEIPEDILLPSKFNAVDDKRFTIRGNNSPFAMGGPANYAQSVVKTIQRAIDEDRITVNSASSTAINVTVTPSGNISSDNVQDALEELQDDIDNIDGSETVITVNNLTISGTGTSDDPYIIGLPGGFFTKTYSVILDSTNTLVSVLYEGEDAPTCTLSGSNNSQVNIVIPANTILLTTTISGTDGELDSGNKVIAFSGAGLLGNTSNTTIYVPAIQKVDMSAIDLGTISTSNPAAIDLDNNPSTQIIGVGTIGTPSLSLRINALNTFTKYNLIFKW